MEASSGLRSKAMVRSAKALLLSWPKSSAEFTGWFSLIQAEMTWTGRGAVRRLGTRVNSFTKERLAARTIGVSTGEGLRKENNNLRDEIVFPRRERGRLVALCVTVWRKNSTKCSSFASLQARPLSAAQARKRPMWRA
jgi:hypothetical protein